MEKRLIMIFRQKNGLSFLFNRRQLAVLFMLMAFVQVAGAKTYPDEKTRNTPNAGENTEMY